MGKRWFYFHNSTNPDPPAATVGTKPVHEQRPKSSVDVMRQQKKDKPDILKFSSPQVKKRHHRDKNRLITAKLTEASSMSSGDRDSKEIASSSDKPDSSPEARPRTATSRPKSGVPRPISGISAQARSRPFSGKGATPNPSNANHIGSRPASGISRPKSGTSQPNMEAVQSRSRPESGTLQNISQGITTESTDTPLARPPTGDQVLSAASRPYSASSRPRSGVSRKSIVSKKGKYSCAYVCLLFVLQ